MTQKLKVQVNFDCGKIKKCEMIFIDADDAGIPLDKFWRRRLKDSAIDHCIEVITDSKTDKKGIV